MYSQIICNENCVYQHFGNCYKSTVSIPTSSKTDNKCEFFIQKTVYEFPAKNTFWKNIIQNYYN